MQGDDKVAIHHHEHRICGQLGLQVGGICTHCGILNFAQIRITKSSGYWIGVLFTNVYIYTFRGSQMSSHHCLQNQVAQKCCAATARGDEGMELSGWLAVHVASNADITQPVT